ncbi:hypothetical protein [Enterovirga sp.]|uniref:hypothetical protein n=1 Tax=Enterovirga sp. TaxID=2026350 RepID=UPI002C06A5AC|nr:hypothetical protein [Enterovirga sp.]HMO29769.1 hypothetical protein [Enterovirga sp.]
MFRLLCGLAIIAFIFVHSQERPKESLPADASRWAEHARDQAVQAALRSDLARDLVRTHLAPNEKGTR